MYTGNKIGGETEIQKAMSIGEGATLTLEEIHFHWLNNEVGFLQD